MSARLYHAVIGTLSLAGLAFWLLHLTYSPWPALVLVLVGALLIWHRPATWLVIMPALWPIIDLVPGTGRMYLAESDALAMLCIGALSMRALFQQKNSPAVVHTPSSTHSTSGPALSCVVLLSGIVLSYIVSSIYALTPLPPFDENAFVGYASPFNSLRLSKGILWAILLLPHWLSLKKHPDTDARSLLRVGMTLGLTSASLAALWDRAAFNGLLDLASEYRTTALFWEMHVGGAALDGWLMLTLPFAIAGLLGARRPLAVGLHMIVLALAAYAVLTTFSRGVYLGCGVMLLCVVPAWWRQRSRQRNDAGSRPLAVAHQSRWLGPLLLILITAAAVPVFHGGGYRSLAAMFAASGVVYLAGGLLRPMRLGTWLPVLCIAAPLAGLSYLLHDQFYKAAYWIFGAALLSALTGSYFAWRQPGAGTRIALAIGASWCAAGVGWVSWHWGGDAALSAGLVASALLCCLLFAQTMAPSALWALEREQAIATLVAGVMMLMIAVGAGSYFIGSRFSTAGEDFGGRVDHWRHGIGLIQNAREWAFGVGVGRYAERYYWQAPIDELPGVWRIAHDPEAGASGKAFLRLVGPRYPMGANQLLRVSQRIGLDVRGPFAFRLRARAPGPVSLKLEVCQKHLLYSGDCVTAAYVPVPGGKVWTEIDQRLSDQPLANTGRWYAPQIVNFAIAIRDKGKSVDVDDIELLDASGNSLLENGDFTRGADNWFFSSDRVHLPYHAKSIAVHLLVEQGLCGLLVVALACLTAMWRLGFGRASRDPAAPVVLAALGGFLTVGLFDSLLDVPRDAVFFFLLLGIALAMRSTARTKV